MCLEQTTRKGKTEKGNDTEAHQTLQSMQRKNYQRKINGVKDRMKTQRKYEHGN